MTDLERWRELPVHERILLRDRLALARVRRGDALGDSANPLELALRYDPTIVARGHHEVIADAIAGLHRGEQDRTLIVTPPQVGKSTIGCEWALAWWLSLHPRDHVAAASYGQRLAEKRGRAVRRFVRTYGGRYGLQLDPENATAAEWSLQAGGGMRSVGVDGGLTGNPITGLAVIDDPHKDRAEADSPVERERVWDWWSSTVQSRLAPADPQTGRLAAPCALILTRWHEDDLAGRLLKEEGRVEDGGRWRVVHLPAIAVTDDDELGRKIGDPLPHPKITEGDLEALVEHWRGKQRSSTVRDWAALYQGDPTPREGALLTPEQARAATTRELPAPRRVAVAIDPSGGGRDEAGIIGGRLGVDGRCYATHDRSQRATSDEWGRIACELAHELEADVFAVEKAWGDTAKYVLKTSWRVLTEEQRERRLEAEAAGEPFDERPFGHMPRVREWHAKRGKVLRAEPIGQQLVEGRAMFGPDLEELKLEWTRWQPGSPWSPGRIDAHTYLVYELLPVPGSESVVSNPNGRTPGTGRTSLTRAAVQRPRAGQGDLGGGFAGRRK